MAHPEYENIGSPETLVMEECSELIKALCKVQRFGWFECHPVSKEKNIVRVLDEVSDVENAIEKLKKHILQLHTTDVE